MSSVSTDPLGQTGDVGRDVRALALLRVLWTSMKVSTVFGFMTIPLWVLGLPFKVSHSYNLDVRA